ncbi:MAG: acetoacetate--CoA ligase, partial [Theionarchaea archaeon]|nr:acetoacetate--CoA ligase [Theionarchaea archaeon]
MKALWYPSEERKKNANMTRYMKFLEETRKLIFKDYNELYRWSISERANFWSSLWDFFQIKASRPYDTVLETPD